MSQKRVLTYGSETWRLTKEQERKSRSAQIGITWRDEKRAAWIRDILMTTKKDAQNGQQMDKKGTGMATKKLLREAREGRKQRRNSDIRRCRMEYTNIRQRKVERVRKGLMMLKCILKTL